jgi:hypothetical protein
MSSMLENLVQLSLSPISAEWRRWNGFGGIIDHAEFFFFFFLKDFLGEYEAICELALGRESGGVDWWKKPEGQKYRAIVPLKVKRCTWVPLVKNCLSQCYFCKLLTLNIRIGTSATGSRNVLRPKWSSSMRFLLRNKTIYTIQHCRAKRTL